ncbi:MAG: SRPBCC family protein [Terriglobales bacterium]
MTITTRRKDYPGADFSRRSDSANMSAAASVLGGTALAAYGITRRTWGGAALALGGACIAAYGVTDAVRPYSGKVRVSYTIGRPREDIYEFVRDSKAWSQFLHGLAMESTGGDTLRLTFGESAGFQVTSEAQITDEEPGKFIAWSSGAGPLQHRGIINFKTAPGECGTEVSVAFEFKAPAGPVARTVAQFVGWDPEQLVRESLRHLKELLEAGEIPTTNNQSVGARGFKGAALRVLYREGVADDSTQSRLAGD